MSKKILLAQLDQKKKSTGISTAETRLSHLFHRDIWQTLGLSSPEVGRPAHLTAASCINDGHQLVHLHTPPWLTGHWHGTAVGAAGGKREAVEELGLTARKQPLFDFICSPSLVVPSASLRMLGTSSLRHTACLRAKKTSFSSPLPADWNGSGSAFSLP